MRKLAPWILASFGFLVCSSVALADEPPPKMDMGGDETTGAETTGAETTGSGETTSSGGETTTTTTTTDNGDDGDGDEKKGCSVVSTDDALIGAGALVLLVAGVGLRRREG